MVKRLHYLCFILIFLIESPPDLYIVFKLDNQKEIVVMSLGIFKFH